MSTRHAIRVRSLLPILLVAGCLPAGDAVARYQEAVLDNGLRVVLIEHRANPMVASSVVVGAGGIYETEGQSGASHLLEHMLFNGTTTRTQRELYDAVDRYGAYNNATTREDHTLFTLLIQKEYAKEGLDIQADMLFRSTIPEENFEKEKNIVLEEMSRDASDPGYTANEHFRSFAFAGTPLSRPVLGTVDSIAAISREALLRYYKARYVPSNMVLVVMGDFAAEDMLETVRRTFGSAPKGKAVGEGFAGSWPAAPQKNLGTFPLDAPRVYVQAALPLGLSAHDPLVPAVELLLAALADGEDAPLQRSLAGGADPAATGLSLGLNRRAGPWSTVELEATLPPEKPAAPVLQGLADGLRRLGRGSAARSRLDLVRAATRAREILEADQIHYFALTHSNALIGAPAGWLERIAERFDGVTSEQLDLAAAHLTRQLQAIRITVSGPAAGGGESRWVPAESTPAREADARRRVDRSLASGMRVIVERNDDSQVFAVHLLARDRSASEPEGKDGIVSFLHRLMPRGTTTLDGPALSARLARLGTKLKTDDDGRVPYDDYYTTQEFSFVRAETPAEGWRETVGLLADVVMRPRMADGDVEAVRREMLDLIARRAASSRSRALAALEQAIAPGHPLARPVLGTDQSIASITADDLRGFHRAYFTGPRLIVSVVSPLDPEDVVDAVESAFRGIPVEPALAPTVSVPVTGTGTRPALPTEPPEQMTIAMAEVFDARPEDRPALVLAGALLSDELAFELRERRGLAYSIGASIAPWGGRMRLLITMGTRKENLDEAMAGLREGIGAFRPKDDDAVRRAAAALRGRMLMRRLTRINQAYFLGLEALDGRPLGDDLAQLDALLSLDVQRVAAAAAGHLDPSRLVVVAE